MEKKTTIVLTKKTHGRLMTLGSKGESFEDIISRLLDFYEKNYYVTKYGMEGNK